MSIRPHGSGYQVRVYAGLNASGRPRYIYRTARTLKLANSLERSLATQVEQGRHRGGKHTFGELLDGWWDLKSPDLAENTRRGYEGWIKRVVRPELGELELAKLTPDVLDRLYSSLRASYANRTVRQIHAIIRGTCETGVRWSWLVTNPAAQVRPPKLDGTGDVSPPEPSEARKFLAALATEDRDLMMFLRASAILGTRRGETCGLRWSDFDLESGGVVVARSLFHVRPAGIGVKAPKTGKPRVVALDATTTLMFTAYQKAAETRDEVLGGFDPDSYVFQLDDATPWPPDHATRRYKKAAKTHGVKARLHDWRHYAATQMLDAGIPAKTVADRLGHANPSVTLSTYAHAIPATDRLAADALAATLD